MKRLTLWFMAILIAGVSLLPAQTVISDNPFAAGDADERLDVISTAKGVLLPRMTTAQRDAGMATTTEGMLIYNTTDGCYQYYDGTAWNCLTDTDSNIEPWYGTDDNMKATDNTEDIYQRAKVGIGTSNPTHQLDVVSKGSDLARFFYDDASTRPRLFIKGATNKISLLTSYNTGGATLTLGTNTAPNAVNIIENGNVGIGTTTPKSPLHIDATSGGVYRDVYVQSPAGASYGIILNSPNGNCWRIRVNNTGVLTTIAVACP